MRTFTIVVAGTVLMLSLSAPAEAQRDFEPLSDNFNADIKMDTWDLSLSGRVGL